MTENVPTPPVSVLPGGKTACESVLVNATVPVYPVTTFPYGSKAVTKIVIGIPTTAMVGATSAKCVAPAGVVSTALLVPVTSLINVSVAASRRA